MYFWIKCFIFKLNTIKFYTNQLKTWQLYMTRTILKHVQKLLKVLNLRFNFTLTKSGFH